MSALKTRAFSISLALLLSVVTLTASAQCTKDTECKGDRICVKNACTDPAARDPTPSPERRATDEMETAVKSLIEHRVASESHGTLSLQVFTKTRSYPRDVVHGYVLEWQAEIMFVKQGWKTRGDYWSDFQVWPAQDRSHRGSWIHFDQGTRLRLHGDCKMFRTEQGWRIEELSVNMYERLVETAIPMPDRGDPSEFAKVRHWPWERVPSNKQFAQSPHDYAKPTTNNPNPPSLESFPAAGNWRGNVKQFLAPRYSVVFSLQLGNLGTEVGMVEYPELSCGGYLALLDYSSILVRVSEEITYGDCVSGGTIVISKFQGDRAEWAWYNKDGKRQATAEIARGANR